MVKLAVYFDTSPSDGGGFQQSLRTLRMLLGEERIRKYEVKVYVSNEQIKATLRLIEIQSTVLILEKNLLIFQRLRKEIGLITKSKLFQKLMPSNQIEKYLVAEGVDLVYFLSPNSIAEYLEKVNFIYTVWDVSHIQNHEFPEVRGNWQIEYRESKLNHILPRAHSIVVESEYTKRQLTKRYGLDSDRMYIIPPQPLIETAVSLNGTSCSFKQVKTIDIARFDRYILYPAQFWPHKNHVFLLAALKHFLANKWGSLKMVFTGGDKGDHMSYVTEKSVDLELSEEVFFLGFVSQEHILSLYKNAFALAMPSYFGPTNLPPVEAFEIGLPVLAPLRDDHKEFLGDGALYFDYTAPSSLALLFKRLISEEGLRDSLIRKGKSQLTYIRGKSEFNKLINKIDEFEHLRECWR